MALFKAPKWWSQLRQTWQLTVPRDPAVRWIVPLTFVGVTFAFYFLGTSLGGWGLVLSVTSWGWGVLAAAFTFGRRAEKAAFGSIEGVPGAAAEVLKTMRSGWFTTPAIEFNRNQELVHRVVGRCGVVLVVEAKPGAQIASIAKQKTVRWVGSDVPIHEVYVGTGAGQVPLAKLTRHILKIKRVLRGGEVSDLNRRLAAATPGPNIPLPKGPMPKNMKAPRR